MKKILLYIFLLQFSSLVISQDLQTVLNNNNLALGLESRKKLSNLRTDGHVIMTGTETSIPFKLIQAKPDLLRIETTVFGFKAIQTYDGTSAWMLSPMKGMEAVQTDPRDMEFIAAATSIDGPFSINKNARYTLKYYGKDSYHETPVEVVSWVADTERLKYYINSSTWLVDAVRYEYKKNGGWYSMEYRIKSYREFKGSKFPAEVTAVINGVEMLSLYVNDLGILEQLDYKNFEKPSY